MSKIIQIIQDRQDRLIGLSNDGRPYLWLAEEAKWTPYFYNDYAKGLREWKEWGRFKVFIEKLREDQ